MYEAETSLSGVQDNKSLIHEPVYVYSDPKLLLSNQISIDCGTCHRNDNSISHPELFQRSEKSITESRRSAEDVTKTFDVAKEILAPLADEKLVEHKVSGCNSLAGEPETENILRNFKGKCVKIDRMVVEYEDKKAMLRRTKRWRF